MDNDSRNSRDTDGTSVDLGEDLLEKSAAWTVQLRPASDLSTTPSTPPTHADIQDQFHSARILVNEGLFEEAKKILRHIRIRHPEEVRARDMLDEIHASELKQIFGEEPGPRHRRRGAGHAENEVGEVDPDAVLAGLDRDLHLNLEEDSRPLSPLFDDEKAIQEYADRLDHELADLGGRDRLDLGIAFLEMNFFEVAIRQFRAACREFLQDPGEHAHDLLVCTGLIAHATIAAGRAFEATMQIQAVLRDAEVRLEDKLEFIYLMGRAYDQLKKPIIAAQWYEQVRKIDPHYRDADRRLKAAQEASQGS